MTTGYSSISAISANQALAQSNQTSQSDSQSQLMDNYDTFLQLLTTQIQNQNPTDPLDAQDFTDQLVQYSSIEQQILMNDSLEALLEIQREANTDSLVSYIGKNITATGDVAVLENGAATWNLEADAAVENLEVAIFDQYGALVATEQTSLDAGENSFTWDGTTSAGLDSSDGAYTISVYGTDADGNFVAVDTNVTGLVQEIDLTGSEPALSLGDGAKIPLSSVMTVWVE